MDWIENETPEDRHERIDRVLEKNAKPLPKCITCLQTIQPHHTLVESRHGSYHGAPLTCVDGR